MQRSRDSQHGFPPGQLARSRPPVDLLFLVLFAVLVLSAGAAPPCPEGIKPKKALSLFLPGGFILDFLLYSIDPLNNCYQIWVFWSNGDKGFACFSALFVALTLCAFCALIKIPGSSTASSGSLTEECRRSSGRGILTESVARSNFAKEAIQAPGTGLVNIYGLSRMPALKLLTSASAIYGLYSSSKGIGLAFQEAQTGSIKLLEKIKGLVEQQDAVMGGKDAFGNVDVVGHSRDKDEVAPCSFGGPIVLKKRFGWKWSAFLAYSVILVAGELALFAVMCNVFHPAVVIVGFYFPSAVANAIDNAGSQGYGPCVTVCGALVAPGTLFFPADASLFGTTRNEKLGLDNGATLGSQSRLFAQVFRLVALPAMAWFVDLPNGLPGWELLHRPMGHQVLAGMFLDPTIATYEGIATCAASLASKSVEGCALPVPKNDESAQEPGTTIYRAFLTCMVCIALPIHLIGSAPVRAARIVVLVRDCCRRQRYSLLQG